MDGSDADAFLLGGEDDGADFHFGGDGVGRAPVDRHGAAEIDGNFLEQAALVVAQDDGAAGEFRLGEVGSRGAGIHFQEPGGNGAVALLENEGQAVEVAIGLRGDLPGGDAGGATQAFLRGEKRIGAA